MTTLIITGVLTGVVILTPAKGLHVTTLTVTGVLTEFNAVLLVVVILDLPTCFDRNSSKSTNFSASRLSCVAARGDLAVGSKSKLEQTDFEDDISRESGDPAESEVCVKFRLISARKLALIFFFLHQQRDLVILRSMMVG